MSRPVALAATTLLLVTSLAVAPGGENGPRRRAETGRQVVVLRTPGPEQVLIRGGTFRMGSDAVGVARARAMCELDPRKDDCDEPEPFHGRFADELATHLVSLRDFWLDRTEVTNRAYRRCVQAGACRALNYRAARSWMAGDDLPVTLVTWHDAVTYCRWRGARLPTEAEWERAARGWGDRLFPWGDVYNPRIANHGRFAYDPLDDVDGFAELAPVGTFPQGNTPEGIADLAGNVEEWVADWYAPGYPPDHVVDPKGPDHGETRVVRGGSYQHGRAWLRTMARSHALPSTRRAWRGFRCARDHRKLATPGAVY